MNESQKVTPQKVGEIFLISAITGEHLWIKVQSRQLELSSYNAITI